jgi:hypothetical protein
MLLHTIVILSEGGDDYSATMESLTFAPGNDTIPHCVTVPILSDVIAEGQEFFLGNLESDGDRVTLSPQETTITILDDDGKKSHLTYPTLPPHTLVRATIELTSPHPNLYHDYV